ncbi:MAG: DUF4159 domain-containing protein [Planctomycetes bacterium]|nr:DUF4159 domain-containing protein [Planctomycetota bacterium]
MSRRPISDSGFRISDFNPQSPLPTRQSPAGPVHRRFSRVTRHASFFTRHAARGTQPRFADNLVSGAFWFFAHIHSAAAWLLSRFGWGGAWLIRPFPWSCRLGAMAAALAILALWLGFYGHDWLLRAAEFDPKQARTLTEQGLVASFRGLSAVARCASLLLAAAAVGAFVRHRLALWLLKAGGAAFAVVWAYLAFFAVAAPSALHLADAKTFDKSMRNDLWVAGGWLWTPPALLAALFLIALCLRSVAAFYCGKGSGGTGVPPVSATGKMPVPPQDAGAPLLGDRVVASLKSPRDPRWRSSSYWAAFIHFAVILLFPLLTHAWGRERVYGVPKGSGNPIVQMVKVKRVERKEKPKKKKFVLNMDSPIIFYIPNIDESQIREQLEKETLDPYRPTSFTGKLGKGGGDTGGWPSGMEGAKVGFIRLEYKGGDWDQDMGVNADYNLLVQFHKITGFKIADNTDHIPIMELRRFRKHRAPPFVFITGSKAISANKKEVDTLRWYCLEEGGMIFADNGGGNFDYHFRKLMRQCFPELHPWTDIANDDILYQQPFVFPNGAPPLWHHSGMRALGLKYNERWVVFYHQGDINDAWKTGHSGATEAQAMQAYRLGINIINYAFNQYMHIHFGD